MLSIYSNDTYTYLEEFPINLVHQLPEVSGHAASKIIVINLQYGASFSGPGNDVFRFDRAVGEPSEAHNSNFLHPCFYYYDKLPTGRLWEFKLSEVNVHVELLYYLQWTDYNITPFVVRVYNTGWHSSAFTWFPNRLLDSLVVECWHEVREVLGSIPSQGPRHTKDVIKMVLVVHLFSTQNWKEKYWFFLKN